MTKQEFKQKYFTNNFYWVSKNNYEKLQNIGIEYSCLNPSGEASIINWHEGFKNLGFRTYQKNSNVTIFQKEPFLMSHEVATNYSSMLIDYKKLNNQS